MTKAWSAAPALPMPRVMAALGAATYTEAFSAISTRPRTSPTSSSPAHTVETAAAELADRAMAGWLAEKDSEAVAYAIVAGPCALPHPERHRSLWRVKRVYVWRPAARRGPRARG